MKLIPVNRIPDPWKTVRKQVTNDDLTKIWSDESFDPFWETIERIGHKQLSTLYMESA